MAFSLYRFGTSEILPTEGSKFDIGAGKVDLKSISFPHGGEFDLLGNDDAYRGGYEIKYSFILYADSPSELVTKYNTLRSYLGKKDKLYRKVDGTTDLQWVYARLESIDSTRESDNINYLRVDLVFFVYSPLWSGTLHGSWRLDSGFVLDTPDLVFDTGLFYELTTPTTSFTVTNGGNSKLHTFSFGITASGSPITSIRVQKAGQTDFSWTGNLAVGNTLLIDFGGLSIKNSGVDTYSGFTLSQANHKLDSWAILEPGENVFTITRTGGDNKSNVSVSYYDSWI